MDASWKFSRVTAVAFLTAAHLLLVYLVLTLDSSLDSSHVISNFPSVEPIIVSLIDRPARLPLPLTRITLKPVLLKVQIAPPETPDFQIEAPAEPTPSAGAVPGLSGPAGPIDQAAARPARAVIHYVAPIYPPQSARTREQGNIAIAVLVNARGTVDQVRIVSSTGSPRLDHAAVSAVRQWRFAPVEGGTGGEPVWGLAKFVFAPPQRLLGVPLIVMPYAAVAGEVDAEISTNHDRVLRAPATEVSVRSLLAKLIAAFPGEGGQDSGANRQSVGESLEAELGHLGPIQSVQFLGFVDHGIDRDKSDAPDLQDLPQPERTHWEAYDVKQDRGSSVWLVAVTTLGSIQRIEVAVR